MDFIGTVEQFFPIDASHEAHAFEASTPSPVALKSPDVWGARAVGSPATPPRTNHAGAVEEQYGGRLFERIILTPRAVGLGMVLTQTQITVEIWNTFRNAEKSLTAITTAGPGSAQFPALVFPVVVPPLHQSVVVVTFPTAGDPTLAETITFVFPGILGTDVLVAGDRLPVFSVAPDWAGGVLETPQIWMTDVLKGITEAEQRIQLRTLPRSRLRFKVLPTGRETAFLEGLLSAWQQQIFGVPFWPDKVPILEPITQGDGEVALPWSGREFAPGGYVLLWRDAFTVEVVTLAGLVVGGVTLNGTAQNNWAADGQTWAVPIRRGRLADKIDLMRKGWETAEVEIAFDMEVV